MLGGWNPAVFKDILKRYDPIILLVKDRINGERFLCGKNEDLIPVIIQVIQQTGAPIQTLLNHCCTPKGFPEMSQTFSSSFRPSWTQWRLNFFLFCASFVILWYDRIRMPFDGFQVPLMRSSDREQFLRDSEAFKHSSTRWTVIQLTFSIVELSVFLQSAYN